MRQSGVRVFTHMESLRVVFALANVKLNAQAVNRGMDEVTRFCFGYGFSGTWM